MADLNDIKLSSKEILKKQFKQERHGYDTDEVDSYLDNVIADYNTFNQIIEDLYGQIGSLQRQLLEAKQKAKAAAVAPAPQPSYQNPNSQSEPDMKTYTLQQHMVSSNGVNMNNNSMTPNNGELSTNMELIQRVSALERKVYNLEQRVYGFQNH